MKGRDTVIYNKLIEKVESVANGLKIKDLRIGLGYTAVLLDNGSCGTAYTFRNELGPCCSVLNEAGKLIGANCSDIILWAKELNLAKAAIGIATINAILQEDINEYEQSNVFDLIDITKDDKLGIIGDFMPLTKGKGKNAKEMYIFERGPGHEGENVYPDYAIDIYLPECNIVVVTSTSIINKTFDNVISKCKNARQIVLVGPTTPLCPEIMKDYGINILAGVKVKDAQKVLETVSQAGGTKSFGKAVEQIVIRL